MHNSTRFAGADQFGADRLLHLGAGLVVHVDAVDQLLDLLQDVEREGAAGVLRAQSGFGDFLQDQGGGVAFVAGGQRHVMAQDMGGQAQRQRPFPDVDRPDHDGRQDLGRGRWRDFAGLDRFPGREFAFDPGRVFGDHLALGGDLVGDRLYILQPAQIVGQAKHDLLCRDLGGRSVGIGLGPEIGGGEPATRSGRTVCSD